MKPLNTYDSHAFAAHRPNVDDCSEAVIFAPGYIQPHGLVLGLQEPTLTIVQVSDNAASFLGMPAADLLGQSLRHVFSAKQVQRIQAILSHGDLGSHNPFDLKIQHPSPKANGRRPTRRFRGTLYRTAHTLLLELEPQIATRATPSMQFYHRLQTAVLRLRQTSSLEDLVQVLAKEMKAIAGFDRIMVYRFEADDHGVVIAEAKEPHLESYLGLHYPAFDIPLPSRQLFCRNWVRQIPDVQAAPALLLALDTPSAQVPVDLSDCVLRGVSPYHIEYLQNMGVAATLTISLIDDQRLWGLVACHHANPRLVDYETRKTCEFLGQFASIELVNQQDRELYQYRAQVKQIQDQLQWAFLHDVHAIEPVLTDNGARLLQLVHAQGAALLLDDQLTLIGTTPSPDQVQRLIQWLTQQQGNDSQPTRLGERTFATHALSQIYPPAQDFTDSASGVLAISIVLSHVTQKSYHILWFRPEQIQTVDWAGNPQDALMVNDLGEMRLCPRKSFELWKETVREMSYPWQRAELEAATEMRNTLMLAVLEFSQAALEEAAERAAIANRAKSQFLAKMSHELRTPLNAILGFTHLMARNQETPTEFQEQLGVISRSGEHLLSLINDVLEMSKIEAGQLSLTETCFDLYRLVLSIQEMFALKASEKDLQLSLEYSDTMPQYCWGDEAKLRQILINLLSNAIKFTTAGAVILRIQAVPCETAPLSSSHARVPITLQIEVDDTGAGIAPMDLDTIFEAFIQTDQGRYAQGTGLGLPISRQFARLMGGDITVRSVMEQGTTFCCQVVLHLPQSLDAIEPELHQQVIGLELEQPIYRILVAEDVAENRQLLVTLLRSVGFEVQAVENGVEAIAQWRSWHPHLILMDIQMPEMNGYEATRQIRTLEQMEGEGRGQEAGGRGQEAGGRGDGSVIPAASPTPIIALTAYAFEEDRAASFQAGCNDHIAKPFTSTMLFNKMAYYLGIRYRYSEELPLQNSVVPKKNLSPQDMGIMALEWISQVHDAALDLDDLKLRQLIAHIPQKETFLIEAMTFLVDNFQLEAIANLTQV